MPSSFDDVGKALDALKGRNTALEEGQTKLEGRNTALEERQTKLEGRNTALEKGQTKLEADNKALQKQVLPRLPPAHLDLLLARARPGGCGPGLGLQLLACAPPMCDFGWSSPSLLL